MSLPINTTESGLLITGQGKLKGVVVNSHTSGTMKIWDSASPSVPVQATTTLTSTGAVTVATHAVGTLTSTGASVPGSHAVSVFTKSSAQFLDSIKASAVLTSDQTQPTAAKVVVLGAVTYTFTALGGSAVNTATACDVPLGNTTAETMDNLYNAFLTNPLVDTVRTSTYVITVTAKTAGAAGNDIAATEDDSHLDWDGSNTTLTGGADAETITIGSRVYTWRDTVTTTGSSTACEVKIGSTLTVSLANLVKAINHTGTPGLEYSFAGAFDPVVVATASDGTTVTVRGRVPGTSLNTAATTETCTDGSWPDTTLGGGTGASDAGVTTAAATVTIGDITYTTVDALSETYGATAIPYQVLKGASEATMLDNLKLAINGTGTAGTHYSTGTVAHTAVIATTNADDSQVIQARVPGTTYNTLATTETLANTAWGGATLVDGVTTAGATFTIGTRTYTVVDALTETSGATAIADQILWVTSEAVFLDNVKLAINGSGTAGTQYSTGTTTNYDVTATTNANDSQVFVARKGGTAGNAIATTDTMANYAFTSTVMASGLGSTSTVLFNTITPIATASLTSLVRMIDLGDVDFSRGLYVTVGGTLDATFVVDTN